MTEPQMISVTQIVTIIGSILVPIAGILGWIYHLIDKRFDKVDQRFEKIETELKIMNARLSYLEGYADKKWEGKTYCVHSDRLDEKK